MIRFRNSIIIELKLMIRNKVNIIPLVALFFIITFGAITVDPVYDIFTSSDFFTQVLILSFMILGYNIENKENIADCTSLFVTIDNSRKVKLLSKMITSISIVILLNFLFYLIVLIKLTIVGASLIFYFEGILYMFLYWLLPSLIALFIGISVGLVINNVLSYIVIIIISLFIGPMNRAIHQSIGLSEIIDIRKIIVELNIGQYANYAMDSLYGFEIEKIRFLHNILFLLIVIIVFLIISLIKGIIRGNILHKCILLLVVIFILGTIQYQKPAFVYKNGHFEDTSKNQYDTSYYQGKKLLSGNYNDFKIVSNDITIKDDSILNVLLNSKIQLQTNCREIYYTLYRDFKIISLEVNGKKSDFTQVGDFITIRGNYNKGEMVNLHFEYKGPSSPNFYFSTKAVLLANYFPWLPKSGHYPIMHENQFTMFTYLTENYEIKYSLTYEGSKKIYTNLNEVKSNHYEGYLTQGVMFVSGLLKEYHYKDTRIVYPISFNNFAKSIDSSADIFISTLARFNAMLNLSSNQLPKNIYILPLPQSLVTNQSIINLGESVIINSNVDMELREDFCVEKIAGGLINSINAQAQNSDILNLFVGKLSTWYGYKYHVQTYGTLMYLTKNERIKSISDKITLLIKANDDQKTLKFFSTWLEELNKEQSMSIEKLETIIY